MGNSTAKCVMAGPNGGGVQGDLAVKDATQKAVKGAKEINGPTNVKAKSTGPGTMAAVMNAAEATWAT